MSSQHLFDYPVADGITDTVVFEVSSYANNGNLYVHLLCGNDDEAGMPYGDVSINISPLAAYQAAIKTCDTTADVIAFLECNNLGKLTGEMLYSGYCSYPVFQFDRDILQRLDPGGCARYEEHQKRIITSQANSSN